MTDDRPGTRLPRLLVLAGRRKNGPEAVIAGLRAAEAAASRLLGARKRDYHVSYRISEHDDALKGDANARRAALVEVVQSLEPAERHLSTSSWLVRVHLNDAGTLVRHLSEPLVEGADFLSVAEVTPNRAAFGNARLGS